VLKETYKLYLLLNTHYIIYSTNSGILFSPVLRYYEVNRPFTNWCWWDRRRQVWRVETSYSLQKIL